jgi:hypothetical protein
MKVKVEGLREVEQALLGMKTATAKGVVRRVLLSRAKMFADDMRPRVSVDQGALRDSIGVGTKLTRRQSKLNRKGSPLEVYAGAGGLTQAITEEFGTVNQAPDPSARPAWDATHRRMLDGLVDDFTTEIAKTAARVRKRAK